MKIWYCQVHRAAESAEEGTCEVAARILLVPGPYTKSSYPEPCQFGEVPMLLIPDNAETVEQIADIIYEIGHLTDKAVAILAAFDAETPREWEIEDALLAQLADIFGLPPPVVKVLLKSREGCQLLGINHLQGTIAEQVRKILRANPILFDNQGYRLDGETP